MPGKDMHGIKNVKQYEAIKKKLMKEGMSEDAAQTRAAKITNAQEAPAKKKK